MRQRALTVITEIEQGRSNALRTMLQGLTPSPFERVKSVHYASFVLLPGDGDSPSRLVLETNYDGDEDAHLRDLAANAGTDLDRIYAHCKCFIPGRGPDALRAFLKGKSQPTTAFYVAFPGRCVDDIRNAICVYKEAAAFLDANRGRFADDRQAWGALVEHFSQFQDPDPRRPRRSPISFARLRWRVGLNFVRYLVPGVLFALVVPFLLVITRLYECREARNATPPRHNTNPTEAYVGLNLGRLNHMCTFATVKASRFRLFMLRLGLGLTNLLANKFFLFGKLEAMTTIHFARWILLEKNDIDQRRRVLFLSNYDGSWSGYIADFADPPHLNAVWGNTENFPPTKFLLWQGAKQLDHFNQHVVDEFRPTLFFHRPYADHSVTSILRYLKLRDKLAEAM